MSSYRQILYHIVFRTKYGSKVLNLDNTTELYAYIMGYIKNHNSFLYQINGMEDHIHILCDLHPSIALADFIRDMKVSSSLWLKSSGKFPAFMGWADGYAALTYAWRDKERIIQYIKNQRIHHKKEYFLDEFRRLLIEQNVSINENYFP